MKKKSLAILTASAMAVFMAACGGSGAKATADTSGQAGEASPASTDKAASTASDETEPMVFREEIRLLNDSPEIDVQLRDLAARYQEETGNLVTIETVGDGTSLPDQLKQMYQNGNMPDIFAIEAGQAANWNGLLEDLAADAWTENTDYELTSDTMGTIGFPYRVEATALAYNADILEKAGIDPESLTGPSAWKAACETLDTQKEALGLTSVFGWCAEPTGHGWFSGTDVFAQYLDAGLAYEDTTYIDLLNDGGQIDEARMLSFAEFVGMMNQYSDPALLVDGTYESQAAGFAEGRYAFVTQSNRIHTAVTENPAYSGFGMGFAPFAFEEGMDTIIAGSTGYWAVYSEGESDAARAFLQWVSEDSAQDILVNEAGLISPFKNRAYSATDPFAESIRSYMDAGRTSGWHTMLKKEDLQDKISPIFADYAAGTITDAQGFVDAIAQAISDCYSE